MGIPENGQFFSGENRSILTKMAIITLIPDFARCPCSFIFVKSILQKGEIKEVIVSSKVFQSIRHALIRHKTGSQSYDRELQRKRCKKLQRRE
jgi:hypothetical protein